MDDPTDFLISASTSIRDAIAAIDAGGKGIALIADAERRLISTITDGDIRRAILDGIDIGRPVAELLQRKTPDRKTPLVATVDHSDAELVELMDANGLRHIPVTDEEGRVVRLAIREELQANDDLAVAAVIMAGGFGTRLRPLTDDTPKPMLKIGGTPLLQRTVERLRKSGIRDIKLTTHYLPEKIHAHFGDGSEFGVKINYFAEDQPLGTAGSLSMLPQSDEPLIVINGDILTGIDFNELVKFHQEHQAELTVGVRQYDFKVPYGVIEARHGVVQQLKEKPRYEFLINAGIYLLEPSVRELIPSNCRFDMTQLIESLLAQGRKVVTFPVVEYWLDIGQLEDFQRAQHDVQNLGWAA